jgi:biotin operon repressor
MREQIIANAFRVPPMKAEAYASYIRAAMLKIPPAVSGPPMPDMARDNLNNADSYEAARKRRYEFLSRMPDEWLSNHQLADMMGTQSERIRSMLCRLREEGQIDATKIKGKMYWKPIRN